MLVAGIAVVLVVLAMVLLYLASGKVAERAYVNWAAGVLAATVALEVALFFVVVDLFGRADMGDAFVAMGFTLAAPAAAGALAVLVLVLLALPPGPGRTELVLVACIAGGFLAVALGVLAWATWGWLRIRHARNVDLLDKATKAAHREEVRLERIDRALAKI